MLARWAGVRLSTWCAGCPQNLAQTFFFNYAVSLVLKGEAAIARTRGTAQRASEIEEATFRGPRSDPSLTRRQSPRVTLETEGGHIVAWDPKQGVSCVTPCQGLLLCLTDPRVSSRRERRSFMSVEEETEACGGSAVSW